MRSERKIELIKRIILEPNKYLKYRFLSSDLIYCGLCTAWSIAQHDFIEECCEYEPLDNIEEFKKYFDKYGYSAHWFRRDLDGFNKRMNILIEVLTEIEDNIKPK